MLFARSLSMGTMDLLGVPHRVRSNAVFNSRNEIIAPELITILNYEQPIFNITQMFDGPKTLTIGGFRMSLSRVRQAVKVLETNKILQYKSLMYEKPCTAPDKSKCKNKKKNQVLHATNTVDTVDTYSVMFLSILLVNMYFSDCMRFSSVRNPTTKCLHVPNHRWT